MAVITEEPDSRPETSKKEPTSPPETDPNLNPQSNPNPNPNPQPTNPRNPRNPFAFWFFVTVCVSIIALSFVSLFSLWESNDPKSLFLSLSSPLKQHYLKGRIIKVQMKQNQAPIEVFAFESDKSGVGVSENVVIVHGLGLNSFAFRKVVDSLGSKGVHGVVFDLPGHGFSDKAMAVVVEEWGERTFLEKLLDGCSLIKEKGLFWAFDHMVETGKLPYEEIQSYFSKKKRRAVRPAAGGSEEMGRVLGQLIETMGLAPVHLVLHDSSLAMVGNWVSENSDLVRSVTLVDTASRPALRLWLLESPALRIAVPALNFAYRWFIRLCCSAGISASDLEAHRKMFNARNGVTAVMAMDNKLNSSFDVAEWGSSDGIKGMPLQVIWSGTWSKGWSAEGGKVAKALPQAKFHTHRGGRWPQEDAADELAEYIVGFVSALPKSTRAVEEDKIPEHIQQMLDNTKAEGNDHQHGHGGHDHGHGHGHAHPQAAGFMDAYGLGHAWGS